MNPTIFANPARISAFQSRFPYIEPSFGKHAADWTPEELIDQRCEYLKANRQVLPGFGKHRKNREHAA